MKPTKRGLSDGMYMAVLVVNAICLLVMGAPVAAQQSEAAPKETQSVSMEVPLPRYEEIVGIPGESDLVRFVEFEAAVVVTGEIDDVERFENLQRTHESRIKATLDEAIRATTPEAFQEPSLNQVRTLMRTGLNALFEDELVDEIRFGSFRAFESPKLY